MRRNIHFLFQFTVPWALLTLGFTSIALLTGHSGSFARMLALIRNLQYQNCSAVLEDKNALPNTDGTKSSKAELITALRNAFAIAVRHMTK